MQLIIPMLLCVGQISAAQSNYLLLLFLKLPLTHQKYIFSYQVALIRETAKVSFDFRVQVLPAHPSTTYGGGSTLPRVVLNVTQESCS